MISTVIAEDQSMLRQAMVQLMELHEEIDIVATAGDGAEAWKAIQTNKPNIAILDIEMPSMSGLEILSNIRKNHLDIKVIIVTTFKRPGYFETAVANDVDAMY